MTRKENTRRGEEEEKEIGWHGSITQKKKRERITKNKKKTDSMKK